MTHSSSGLGSDTASTRRVLGFSPPAVFDAFADPALLAAWWGPQGFTNTFNLFEFKPNGQWQFVMHGPDGADYTNQCVFLDVNRPSRVVIEHVNAPRFVLTVELLDQSGKTEILWNQKFENPQIAASLRPVVEPANEQNLDRLTAVLSSLAGTP